jgi:hypothetical protein
MSVSGHFPNLSGCLLLGRFGAKPGIERIAPKAGI